MYDFTGENEWRQRAAAWTEAMRGQQTRTDTHDLGFMLLTCFGEGYRLTGDPSYRDVLMTAAASLEERYSATVGGIGAGKLERYGEVVLETVRLHGQGDPVA